MKSCVKVLLLILLIFASTCAEKKDDTDLTFLFVPGIEDPFYYTMEEGIRAEAKSLGVRVVVSEYPTVWAGINQIAILEEAAARFKPDLVIISPVSTDAMVMPLKKLHDAGITIITVDTYIGDGNYTGDDIYSFPLMYIGSDNIQGGHLAAEHLAGMLGDKGKVYCMATVADTSSIVDRINGFKAGIDSYPNIELVGIGYCHDRQSVARQLTLDILQQYPDIAGIFAVNVFSAQGTYQAVVDSGLSGAVKIAAYDATQPLFKALMKGKVDMLIAQKPAEMGQKAVQRGYAHLVEKKALPAAEYSGFVVIDSSIYTDPEIKKYIYREKIQSE